MHWSPQFVSIPSTIVILGVLLRTYSLLPIRFVEWVPRQFLGRWLLWVCPFHWQLQSKISKWLWAPVPPTWTVPVHDPFDSISIALATLMIVLDFDSVSRQCPYFFNLSSDMQFLITPSSIFPVALTIDPFFSINCIRCRNGFGFSMLFYSSNFPVRDRVIWGIIFWRGTSLYSWASSPFPWLLYSSIKSSWAAL
jgi:hypothetical protein